jgi:hypothetical protein
MTVIIDTRKMNSGLKESLVHRFKMEHVCHCHVPLAANMNLGSRLFAIACAMSALSAYAQTFEFPGDSPPPNVPYNVTRAFPVEVQLAFGDIEVADFNGDGYLDITLLGRNGAGTGVADLFGDVFVASEPIVRGIEPDFFFEFKPRFALRPLWFADAAWTDYNLDGFLDLLTLGATYERNVQGTIVGLLSPIANLYRGAGSQLEFDEATFRLEPVYSGSADWADYDNDGDPDLVYSGLNAAGSEVTHLYRNDGSAGLTDVQSPLPAVAHSTVSWADVDADGDHDLLVSGATASGRFVADIFRNDGGLLTAMGQPLKPVAYASSAWGDFDADGDLDLVLAGARLGPRGAEGTTTVYRNDGGRFSDTGIELPGVHYGDLKWLDYDLDGRLDLLLSGTTTTFGYAVTLACIRGLAEDFECESVPLECVNNPACGASPIPGMALGSIAVFDYNPVPPPGCGVIPNACTPTERGDGRLDLILSGTTLDGRFLTNIYRNIGGARNSAPTAPDGLVSEVTGTTVSLSWDPAFDANMPDRALSYNLRVGTAPGLANVLPSFSLPEGGSRRIMAMGNAGMRTSWALRNLAPRTYFWSVQAVDYNYAGSPFAEEMSFTIETGG